MVDDALAALAAEDPSFLTVTTKDLKDRGDRLHYDTASQHEFGKRLFTAWQDYRKKFNTAK